MEGCPLSVANSPVIEPIAIVAVACRFPGAPDPDAFWEEMFGAVDAIREIPDDRFDVDFKRFSKVHNPKLRRYDFSLRTLLNAPSSHRLP